MPMQASLLSSLLAFIPLLGFSTPALSQQIVSDPNIIHKDYHANKIYALDKYNNKTMTVLGIVDDIEMGYVQVDSRRPLGGAIFCHYTNSIDEIKRLSPGQSVSATGRLMLAKRTFVGLKVHMMGCAITPR